jgi:teichuronic acid biosynthesis glycosyltransferase TuaC
MKLLVVAASYPHPGHPYSGIFNERCVHALSKLCEAVEVLVPRPYVPPLVSLMIPRWKAYRAAAESRFANGMRVSRPATPVLPHWGGALWVDRCAFLWCRNVAQAMHRRTGFDAILSFDLLAAGGLAWRIARELGVPAGGWATGSDVRVPRSSSFGRSVVRALEHLHVVFYQSRELLKKAAGLLGLPEDGMSPGRHVVLPRGIPEPPSFLREKSRKQLRSELKVGDNAILVLSVGRISRDKGIFEFVEVASRVVAHDPTIVFVAVGSTPAFDQSAEVRKKLHQMPGLKDRVRLLPACPAEKVWEYLSAADIFSFTSHREGMPNSLLEAMALGVPSIAFAIPAVDEIDAGSGALVKVPPLDTNLFAETILRLAGSPQDRRRVGEKGRAEVLRRFMVRKSMFTALDHLSRIARQSVADRENSVHCA